MTVHRRWESTITIALGIVLLLAAAVLYGRGIARGYFYSEAYNQIPIHRIKEMGWGQVFFDHSYEFQTGRYRPMEMLLWKAMYGVFGMHFRAYLLTGVGFLALASFAVYLCAETIGCTRRQAFAAAGLLAVHPMTYYRVINFEFTTLLVAALFLLAWYFFMRGARAKSPGDGAAALVLFVLAVFTKEVAFCLPLLLLCWSLCEARRATGASIPPRGAVMRCLPFFGAALVAFAYRWWLIGAVGAWRPGHVVNVAEPLRALAVGVPRAYLALSGVTVFDAFHPLARYGWLFVWAAALLLAAVSPGSGRARIVVYAAACSAAFMAPEFLYLRTGPYSIRYYSAFPGFCIIVGALLSPGAGRGARGLLSSLAVVCILAGFLAVSFFRIGPVCLREVGSSRIVVETMARFLTTLPPESRSGRVFLVEGFSGEEARNCLDLAIKAIGGKEIEESLVVPLAGKAEDAYVQFLAPEGMWEGIWIDPHTEEISWYRKNAGQTTLAERARTAWDGKIFPSRLGPSLINHEGWAPTPDDAARIKLPVCRVYWNGGRPTMAAPASRPS